MESKMFLEQLSDNAEALPNKELFRWVDDFGKVTMSHTYQSFNEETSKLAATIMARDGWAVEKGEKVLLVYPPGLDFIVAFVACLKAGVVAVPVYPPRPGFSKDLSMFINVQSDCNAKIALTNSMYNFAKKITGFKQLFTGTKVKWPELRWLVTDQGKYISVRESYENLRHDTKASDIAFFQYTSGSTAKPKGVMISHGNLGHNLSSIIQALNASNSTVVVSWLPCYHDMGLIGSLLGASYCGGSGTYMSPVSFIKNPVLWLEMITKYSATHIQAPNFAYKLVVRKFKERGTSVKLDFSSLKHIFNAAEPIEVESMDEFLKTFAPYKLSRTAMSPGYGLAEHTVYVCDHGEQRLLVDKVALEAKREVIVLISEEEATKGVWIVGCGNPHRNRENGIQVRIVDDKTHCVLGDDMVGEIWVDSDSKANGYFGMQEKTKEDFHAVILDHEGNIVEENRDWLRTGDLGFMHEGELFICGRIKDLIIIRGRNHYPQDIEHSVEQLDDMIRPGCVAAFTTGDTEGKGEYLGIVAEVRDPKAPGLDKLSLKIRQQISSEHGVVPYAIVLIQDRTIPKTTSGKISRFRAKAAFEKNELKEVHRWMGDLRKQFLETEEKNDLDQDVTRDEGDSTQPFVTPIAIGKGDPKVGNPATGEALMERLREEVARLIEGDPDQIDITVPLIQTGMDSMALTQFKGILETTYGTIVDEPELFDEETTLDTIRRRVEGEPPAAKFLDGGVGAGATQPPAATSASTSTTKTSKKKKPKRKNQELFGCFKICGC